MCKDCIAIGMLILSQLLFCPASAASIYYQDMVVFGDSLSDVGNADYVTGGIGSDYYHGRYSNGPLWIEELAGLLALPAPTFSLGGGNIYAYAGAQTNSGSTNVGLQITGYLSTHTPDVDTLYIIWAGSNDLFSGQSNTSVPVHNISSHISQLHSAGARHFLVLNLPPLGSTPAVKALGPSVSSTANQRTSEFNGELYTTLNELQDLQPDSSIMLFDVWSVFNSIYEDPSTFGFSNVTDPAIGLTGIDPVHYLFWDGIHPTTAAHRHLGQSVYSYLDVPEPTSICYLILAPSIAFLQRECRH